MTLMPNVTSQALDTVSSLGTLVEDILAKESSSAFKLSDEEIALLGNISQFTDMVLQQIKITNISRVLSEVSSIPTGYAADRISLFKPGNLKTVGAVIASGLVSSLVSSFAAEKIVADDDYQDMSLNKALPSAKLIIALSEDVTASLGLLKDKSLITQEEATSMHDKIKPTVEA